MGQLAPPSAVSQEDQPEPDVLSHTIVALTYITYLYYFGGGSLYNYSQNPILIIKAPYWNLFLSPCPPKPAPSGLSVSTCSRS